MKAKLTNLIIFALLFFMNFLFTQELICNHYKNLLLNAKLQTIFITLIAGFFGFIIAVIPLAIQIFSRKNSFTRYLGNESESQFYLKPFFNRFIAFLFNMFYLVIFYVCLELSSELVSLFENIHIPFFLKYKIYIKYFYYSLILTIYIHLCTKLFLSLFRSIRDINSLKNCFLNFNEDQTKK